MPQELKYQNKVEIILHSKNKTKNQAKQIKQTKTISIEWFASGKVENTFNLSDQSYY